MMATPDKTPSREELLRQRNELLNAFGGNPWRDGIVAQKIKEIDRRLAQEATHG